MTNSASRQKTSGLQCSDRHERDHAFDRFGLPVYDADGEFVFVTGKGEDQQYYKTGIWPDDGERLLQQLGEHSDIKFSAEIPTQTNPLLSMILTWIQPIFILFIVGELFYLWLRKKMGGQLPGALTMPCPLSRTQILNKIATLTGGRSAEDTASKVDAMVIQIVKEVHKKAYTILRENQDQLHKLAAYLLKKEILTGEEFMNILNEIRRKNRIRDQQIKKRIFENDTTCSEIRFFPQEGLAMTFTRCPEDAEQ